MLTDAIRDLRVARARVTGHGGAASLRRDLETALGTFGNDAVGLPPRAILLVRHLAAPQPLGARPGMFGQAVATALRQQMRRAARPLGDGASAAAPAVLFDCEADLLTAVFLHGQRGMLVGCWWWKTLARGMSVEGWLRRHALTRGDLLPAVLSELAGNGAALEVVSRLSDADVDTAVRAIVAAHGLRVSVRVEAPPPGGENDSTEPRQGVSAISRGEALRTALPELAAIAGDPVRQWLLAIGLGLKRVPDLVRGVDFPRVFEAATAVQPAGSPLETEAVSRPNGAIQPKAWLAAGSATPRRLAEPARPAGVGAAALPATAERMIAGEVSHGIGPAPPASSLHTVLSGHDVADAAAPDPTISAPVGGARHGQTIPTLYGGMFYLLNVALDLGFYGDFTQPRHIGLSVSPWDLVALVGKAVFGRPFQADALWHLLGELAGRDSRQPVLTSGTLRPLMATMRTRLVRTVGDPPHIWRFVCRHDASVSVSASGLDVTFPLDRHPLAIRIAGLDRDPGWIPAAGYSVAFHFG